MKTVKTTYENPVVFYRHQLADDFPHDFYGPRTYKKGRMLACTPTSEKLKMYSVCEGHGAYVYIAPENVEVVKVTQKRVIVEELLS